MTTDYSKTENQESSFKSFFSICRAIRSGFIDVLIIDSTNGLEQAYSISEWLIPLCKEFGVTGYIAHNDSLLSEFNFML